ncbi:MAG TPA: phosphatidylglycerophosphatase A [Blastocatellia bacterium]|nr:phosphatidylglycerophosphatase A [Blastocatellia bacterium]
MIERVNLWIATGAGAGFAPVAPGTLGAAEGVGLFLVINAIVNNTLALTPRWSLITLAIVNVVLFVIGVRASDRAIEVTGSKDPSMVVIDEVSGQLIALTPLIIAPSLGGIFAAFALFRFFDIFKPYPIRQLERLRAGIGVMADDALAGIYAAALTWLGMSQHLI